jgi:hypothetical protein
MHIVLGILGVVVTVLILLHRLADAGIDLGGLNPFLWRRRRGWRQRYEANPIYSLEEPREIGALLVVAVAKIDGDMSAEEKRVLLAEFEATFSMSAREASELLRSTAFLLGDAQLLLTNLDAILAGWKDRLTPEQVDSMLAMMERVSGAAGAPTNQQREFVDRVRAALAPPRLPAGTWA